MERESPCVLRLFYSGPDEEDEERIKSEAVGESVCECESRRATFVSLYCGTFSFHHSIYLSLVKYRKYKSSGRDQATDTNNNNGFPGIHQSRLRYRRVCDGGGGSARLSVCQQRTYQKISTSDL